MFLIVIAVSSRISFFSVFSKMSNQWSFVSFGVLAKSFTCIFPPGTHHLLGKTFSFGERLQIRYLPVAFFMMPVMAM